MVSEQQEKYYSIGSRDSLFLMISTGKCNGIVYAHARRVFVIFVAVAPQAPVLDNDEAIIGDYGWASSGDPRSPSLPPRQHRSRYPPSPARDFSAQFSLYLTAVSIQDSLFLKFRVILSNLVKQTYSYDICASADGLSVSL